MKETEFYEIINKIQKQCVIVTKDMLEFDASTQKSNIKSTAYSLSCPIYRIEKDREGFNENDLSTIRVRTTKIK
jgi:DNA sulfur modification protein DndD